MPTNELYAFTNERKTPAFSDSILHPFVADIIVVAPGLDF